jgi:hypothetical protein
MVRVDVEGLCRIAFAFCLFIFITACDVSQNKVDDLGDAGNTDTDSDTDSDTDTDSDADADSDSDTDSDADSDTDGDTDSMQPFGDIPGTWTLAFHDEFDGTSLDTNTWTTMDGGGWGSTTCRTENVSVSDGNLVLTLASVTSGGCVCTGSSCAPAFGGWFEPGPSSYELPVGGYTEARVYFPGSGTDIYNWPAWWTSGPYWPAGGEHDIAEGCGTLDVVYHSPSGSHGSGSPDGIWSNAFHVYGLHRMESSAEVYYDGVLVASYGTDDSGGAHSLLLDVMDGYGPAVYGVDSQVLVDYVRAWQ